MSETTTEAPTVEPQEQGEPDAPLGEPGLKALAAEREARKHAEKSAAELAARLKQIEDANLTEIERAKKEAAEAKATLDQITRENIRNSVALAKGVPADLVDFLTGETPEAVERQADVLLARLSAPTTPKPDPSQGAGTSTGQRTPADAFAEFFQNRI